LPHGEYTFYLEAFSEDAPSNISKAQFSFTITPPFYLTIWFFVLITFLVLAILFGIYRNQVKKEEAKRANLQLKFQSRLMELESQSLNSSMNRHFIFNSLNSIQYYINMQDRKSANRYLTSFAKLIRKNLDSSQQNETTLKDELERLELYLSLEQMRFQGRFDYEITIAPEVNTEDVKIPAMMLQPFLENSIWHGILPNDEHGNLHVNISKSDSGIEIKISDNGIGVETSKKLKIGSENGHISQGMDITQNRMNLYKNMTGLNYEIKGPSEVKSTDNLQTLGTVVIINLPNRKIEG
jgi:sensor histidine kinase YesM